MQQMQLTSWTPERVALLREMVASGASAREIAIALQCGRGAVTGKCGRMGLQLRGSRRPRGPRVRAEPIEPIEPIESIEPWGVSLIELKPGECRWPITREPPHLFCGLQVSDNRVYCVWHCRVAYRRESMCDEQ